MNRPKKPRKNDPKYSHKRPEHLLGAVKEIISDNDRTTAIVGGALAEDALEQSLRHRFGFYCDEDALDRMFSFSGPAGAFSFKIDLCLAVGIIGPVTYANLDAIREIRNAFAHNMLMLDETQTMTSMSFKSQKIAALCKKLTPIAPFNLDEKAGPKQKYAQLCMTIGLYLLDSVIDGLPDELGEPIFP